MRPTVILSTYNQPAWLEKVLWGYAVQTHRDFDIVVADDGSGDETAELVARMGATAGMAITHVWHEDHGFRKCEILNQAIRVARGEYLIFSDGDCIPRDDFVAAHVRCAEPGRFLGGTTFRLPTELSRWITRHDILSGSLSDRDWLLAHGFDPGWRRALRLGRARRRSALIDAVTTTPARFDGNNASVWREALLAVNGFDMEMGYGFEDRAVGYRLVNFGLRAKQIRNRAICFHLEHERGYVDREVFERNQQIMHRIRRGDHVFAERGIRQLADECWIDRRRAAGAGARSS